MPSGATSNGERLTLIHKQLPLAAAAADFALQSLPTSLFPAWQIKKKKGSTSAFSPQKKKKKENKKAGRKRQILTDDKAKRQRRKRAEDKKSMQYLVFYVNEIAGWHTNVSVNGSKAFLPLQGNPLGWHGLIQWGADWMTHSGVACRIVEETIPDTGVHFVFSALPCKNNTGMITNVMCVSFGKTIIC